MKAIADDASGRRRYLGLSLALLGMYPLMSLAQKPPSISLTHLVAPPGQTLPRVDKLAELAADGASSGGPLRFADPRAVDITPEHHGSWTDLPGGGQLWRYQLQVSGATDLNLGFDAYHLPPGATLHLYDPARTTVLGPFTADDNQPHGEFWSPLLPGDRVVMELFLPPDASPYRLHLVQVGAGYRDLYRRGPQAKQGSCNIDVVCPDVVVYRDQSRSVGNLISSGSFFCSGNMVADVPGSFTPYLLTADHCGINPSNAASVGVYWNYESSQCGDLSGGLANADFHSGGAVVRASREGVDFTLLQLNEYPDPAWQVYYAGWDRDGAIPDATFALHHPDGDERAISFDDDAPTVGESCIDTSPADSHWYVNNWERGTTEFGSSGGGLFRRDSQRLIGWLSGGLASCSVNSFDCFGRFSQAWAGSFPSTRLRDWLDPATTGTLTVEGAYIPDTPPPQRLFQDSWEGS